MKSLLIKLYDMVTAPLYRRLARDLTVQLQGISRSYIDYHERISGKIIDELVRVNLKLEKHQVSALVREEFERQHDGHVSGPPYVQKPDYTDEEIFNILQTVRASGDLIEVCQEKKIPLAQFIHWQSKNLGLEPEAMQRYRLLEETNLEMQRLVTDLAQENRRLRQLLDESTEACVGNGNGHH